VTRTVGVRRCPGAFVTRTFRAGRHSGAFGCRPATLRILQLKAQGLNARIPLVAELLVRHSIDIFLAQETLFNPGWRATIIGYAQYRTPKTDGARGFAIYVKKDLKHEFFPLPDTPTLESLAIRVYATGTSIVVANVYNSPSDRGISTPEIQAILQSANHTMVAGDLTALHPAWNKSRRNKAGLQLYSHSLQQDFTILTPPTPTRVDPRNDAKSMLDVAL